MLETVRTKKTEKTYTSNKAVWVRGVTTEIKGINRILKINNQEKIHSSTFNLDKFRFFGELDRHWIGIRLVDEWNKFPNTDLNVCSLRSYSIYIFDLPTFFRYSNFSAHRLDFSFIFGDLRIFSFFKFSSIFLNVGVLFTLCDAIYTLPSSQ